MIHPPPLLSLALFLAAASAADEPIVVSQKDRTFAPGQMTVKAGQTIRVVNDDRFVHNIHSATDGFEIDSKAQRPGQAFEVTFEEAGAYRMKCAIHPKMELLVAVEP